MLGLFVSKVFSKAGQFRKSTGVFDHKHVFYFYFRVIKPISYILLCLISFQGFSQFSDEQQHQIDSLNTIIASPNSHDTSLAGSYVALSEILYISNIDTLKSLCEKTSLIAEKSLLKNNSEIVKKSLKTSLSGALNNIGYVYRNQGKIKEALAYHGRSLKIREEIGGKSGIANSLNNIGVIYSDQGQVKEALAYFSRSLKIREEIGDKKGIATCLNNIGFQHKSQGQLKEALAYYSRSLKIREEIGDKKGIATCLNNIGFIYDDQGQLKEALAYHSRSLKIYEEIGYKSGIALALNSMGNILNKQGDLKKTLIYGLKSLTISQEIGSPKRIREASILLSRVYGKLGKGMKALEMYKLHITMKDSLNNEATQKASIQRQSKYEYEKQKVLGDAAHDKQLAVEHEQQQRQKVISYSAGGGLALILGFLLFVFNRLKITRKQKEAIAAQKQEIENTHEQLAEHHQEISDSITYAERLQSAILPSFEEVDKYIPNNFILFQPKDVVSGDFYWFENVNGISYVAAADCTGHGVPGALVSVVCSNALNRCVNEFKLTEPSQILDKTRELVIATFAKSGANVKDGMDIAICAINGTKMTYAGANNPLWIVRDTALLSDIQKKERDTYLGDKVSLIEYKATRQSVGLNEVMKPFEQQDIELHKEDTVYLFSDGYADQFGGPKGKKLMYKSFKKLLLDLVDTPLNEQSERIITDFNTWKGDLEQVDDVVVIGFRV